MSEPKKPTGTSEAITAPKIKKRIYIAESTDPYAYLEKRVNPFETNPVKYRFGVELFDKMLEQRKFQRVSKLPREEARKAQSFANFYFDASKGFFSNEPMKAGCIVTDVPSEEFRGNDGEQLFLQLIKPTIPKALNYIDEGDFDDLVEQYTKEKDVYDAKKRKFKKLIGEAKDEHNSEKEERYTKELDLLESAPPKRPQKTELKWITSINDDILAALPKNFRVRYKQRLPKKDRIDTFFATKVPLKATEKIQQGTERSDYIDTIKIELNTCYFVPFIDKLPKKKE